jgi:hypothetical protein
MTTKRATKKHVLALALMYWSVPGTIRPFRCSLSQVLMLANRAKWTAGVGDPPHRPRGGATLRCILGWLASVVSQSSQFPRQWRASERCCALALIHPSGGHPGTGGGGLIYGSHLPTCH